jgi:Carotenoid biosynthesis protein
VKANVIVFEVTTFILFLAFYQGAHRALGRSRNRAFFVGAVSYSLVIESVAVALGIKNFYWYSINSYYKTYPLGGYIVWLGVVPLAAPLLWYMVSATSYLTGNTLKPQSKLWVSSAISGAVAVVFYMLIEPVAVTNHWWTWNVKSFYVIDVPLLSLVAVFGAAFLFTYVFRLTLVDMADPKYLKKLEDSTIRHWPLESKKLTKNLSWMQQLEVFSFRLFASLVVFAAYIAPFVVLFWAVANRGHIKPNW